MIESSVSNYVYWGESMDNVAKDVKVRVSRDEMEAYVSLAFIFEDENYTIEDIMTALAKSGVRAGIQQEKILSLVQEREFGHEVLVAVGKEQKDGVDGFYTYHFNTQFDKKPTIREDGTVDYWSIHAVEMVEQGQVIVTYTEPVDGVNGMNVMGKPLVAKRGRPMVPITGKGILRSPDGLTYYAEITGKIEQNGNRIQVLPIYEISGDVDISTGNIDFRGDVIVHGNVTTGAIVKATGTITIDGIAEACTLEAGKDIILRGGFLGAYKGKISCKGNVYAKFFEYASIEAEGFIEASSALNCTIMCHDWIRLKGKLATIVGGSVYATRGLECIDIGNDKEVRTEIRVGVLKETIIEVMNLENKQRQDEEMISKINAGLKQFEILAQEQGIDVKNDERRVALLRAKISTQATIADTKERLAYLKNLMESGKGAEVFIHNVVYGGVIVSINETIVHVKESQKAVKFTLYEGKVVMFPLE